MNKHPLTAVFLSVIPGAGHLYWNRTGKGLLYLLAFFADILIFGFSIASHSGEAARNTFIIGFLIWGVSFLDGIVTVVQSAAYPPSRAGRLESAALEIGKEPTEVGAPCADTEPGAGDAKEPLPQRQDGSERFRLILLSFIPGLGHFQLGLLYRGTTLLIGFFGLAVMIIFITLLSHIGGFIVFLGILPIIWLLSLFDVMSLLNRKQEGETLQDRSILEDLEAHRESGKKSRMASMLLSVLPGAGHLYLGLQKRGVQLMAGFLFSIYLMDVLHLSFFLFLVPIIWFVGFFDTQQLLSKIEDGETPPDEPIVQGWMNHQRWLGIGLVGIGTFYLLDQAFLDVVKKLWPQPISVYRIQHYMQTGIVSAVLILIGIRLLWLKRREEEE